LHKDPRLEFLRPDIVEKEQRPGTEYRDVVDAVIDEIRSDRVVSVHRESDLQFRPDPVDAAHQHRLAHPEKIRRKEAAETSNLSQHFRAVRLPDELVDSPLQTIA
jgi:hypothetical protein